MAATLKGATAVWFMKDTSFAQTTGNGTAYAAVTGTINIQSATGSRTSDQALLRNNTGDVVAEGYNNDRYEATFETIPSGTDAAQLASAYILPKAGQTVVIIEQVNSANTFMSAQTWIVDNADFRGDLSSPRSISIRMHRYEHSDISADMTPV